MPPKDVEQTFYPPENLRRAAKPEPDFFKIHARIAAMEHPNLAFLWLEYKEEYAYSASDQLTGEYTIDPAVFG